MASLAQVAAQYTFALFGSHIGSDPGHPAVLALGIAFILVLTWLVGLGAIILLYKPESTQYYNAKSARPV